MGAAVIEATDYYERLGVSREATSRDVKAGYAATIRRYPPERFPEEFKRIREAFETLSDPEAREDYDARSDPAISETLERGQAALQEEEFGQAAAAFRRALVIRPSSMLARNLLGLCYLYSDQHELALEQYELLTQEHPRNPTYWTNKGAAQKGLKDYSGAERSFRTAAELAPDDDTAKVGLASVLIDDKRFDQAEELLEQAIHADGVVDFDDISYFLEIIRSKLLRGDLPGLRATAERIEKAITLDWQRERVAYRFATIAQMLMGGQAFEPALALAEKSCELAPGDEQIQGLTSFIRRNRDTIDEWQQAQKDESIRPGLKFMIAVILQTQLSAWDDEVEEKAAQRKAFEVLELESRTIVVGNGKRQTLSSELRYIDQRYPHVAATVPGLVRDRIEQGSRRPNAVLLTCPNCHYQARGGTEGGGFVCPECDKPFQYDPTSGVVQRGSGVTTSGGIPPALVQVVIWIGVIAAFASC